MHIVFKYRGFSVIFLFSARCLCSVIRVFKNGKKTGKRKLVITRSCVSNGEVRLEVLTSRLVEDNPTSTCKKLQYSEGKYNRVY